MSCDVAVWHSTKPLTDAEAYDIYVALADGDTADVEPHPSMQTFLADLRRRYPDIDTLAEVYASDAHVLLCIPWSRAEDLLGVVQTLAAKRRLVCFDPQDSVILTQTS